MKSQPILVLLVDDHTIVRHGIKAILRDYEDIKVVGEAPNGLEAIELVEQLNPDVILMDISMPVMDGIEAIKQIIAVRPGQHILVLTGCTGDDKLMQAVKAGALGYLIKDTHPDELVQAIRRVSTGEPSFDPAIAWSILRGISGATPTKQPAVDLSEREAQVLCLLTKGKTDQEIARQLVLTDVTIRTHVSRILAKLGLRNRVQAALYGIRSGMVPLEETYDIKGLPDGTG